MEIFLQFILTLNQDDLKRFINYLQEWNDYPYFSSLYDLDMFNDDSKYFNSLFNIFVAKRKLSKYSQGGYNVHQVIEWWLKCIH